MLNFELLFTFVTFTTLMLQQASPKNKDFYRFMVLLSHLRWFFITCIY